MLILAAVGITIAWMYYGSMNKSVDPRVKQARVMYGRYNTYAADNEYEKVLSLLDSIADIYASVPHYSNSYEMGVIHNNRASVFLTLALADTTRNEIRQNYFALAEMHLLKGIDYYAFWLIDFENKPEDEITRIVERDFSADEKLAYNENLNSVIRKRVSELLAAQIETPRRLSVSYTNLGIIRRHENQLEDAYTYYDKALDLWPENHAAKNNMNILFGLPPEKQSFFRKLFPPDRN
jgi:tetratricopeptide (TPR) repeat protein